jgi:hypothetical protein
VAQYRKLVKMLFVLMSGVCTAGWDTAPVPDARVDRLETFFRAYQCPSPHHATDYIRAADAHHIDYRLLPAISVLESTCGIYERLNNRWGWNNARSGFESIQAGIEFITAQLAEHDYYKDKPIDGKLGKYNPKPQYAEQAWRLMRQIE